MCVRQYALFLQPVCNWLLLLSWPQFVAQLLLVPQPFNRWAHPTTHHVFARLILISFFPSNSKQSHFSLRPPTGEKQTFKAMQTMSHAYTHSSMKRHTPAKEHQDGQNGHNGSLIIIHKGYCSVTGNKCLSSAAWNDPGVSHNTGRWPALWSGWNRLTHTTRCHHTHTQISWLGLIVMFQLAAVGPHSLAMPPIWDYSSQKGRRMDGQNDGQADGPPRWLILRWRGWGELRTQWWV